MKKILIISRSNLNHDPRVIRQIETFKEHFNVHCIARQNNESLGIDFTPIDRIKYSPPRGFWNLPGIKKIGQYLSQRSFTGDSMYFKDLLRKKYWNKELRGIAEAHLSEDYDVIFANDYNTLPLSFAIRGDRDIPVYYDSHEYFLDEHGDNPDWVEHTLPTLKRIAEEFLPQVAGMMTVSWGIADLFLKEFGVETTVLPNSPEYIELNPTDVEEGKIKLIHHGIDKPNRSLCALVDMTNELDDRFSLDLMLAGNISRELKSTVEKSPKVKFIDPVKFEDIPSTINRYDVSVIFFPPTTINLKHALPNKFFESIQGRLALALGPDEEMVKFAKRYDFGIVSESYDFEDLKNVLNNLTTDRLQTLKNNSHIAAEKEHFGVYQKVLIESVERVLK